MGVLDINDHLKHRRRITEENPQYTWENNESNNGETQTEPPQPARHSPQRKHKVRPRYFIQPPSHKPKGSRSGRRYENTCFLLSLVDHEEINEMELSDIVSKTMTIFSSLFEDPEKMKIWNEFANLPEEDQLSYFHPETHEENVSSDCVTEESRPETPKELYAVAEKSYLTIDKKIRGTFQKKRFSLGGLELLEKEFTSCLTDSPDAVILSKYPSSLDRMMVHALCQYLKLLCKSHNWNGTRLMEIESNSNSFQLPRILLSQYLKRKILS